MRLYLCFCENYYTGEDVGQWYPKKPNDRSKCHENSGCGYHTVTPEGRTVYEYLEESGIDKERLAVVMEPKAERWGQLVHAFEVVVTLEAVLAFWPKEKP